MQEHVSTLEIRRRLGDILNRVSLRHDEFIVERRGKPLAAIVPMAVVEGIREAARVQLREALREPAVVASEEESMRLANDARRWARREHKR